MEGRITTVYERSLTTLVDNIEHIEFDQLNGLAIIKIFLQPGASLDTANAQVTAASQTHAAADAARHAAAADHQLQRVQRADPATWPVRPGTVGTAAQRPRLNFLRTQLVTVPGAVIPYPYGGKQRQVMIDLNPALLQAKGLSPADVLNAICAVPGPAVRHGEDRAVRI